MYKKKKDCTEATVWYKSKRVYLSIITLCASYLQLKYGLVIDGPTQGLILGIIMIIVGVRTNSPLAWSNPKNKEE